MTKFWRSAWFVSVVLALPTGITKAQDVKPERGWAHSSGLIALGRSTPVDRAGSVVDRMLIQEAFARWGIAWDESRLDLIDDLFAQDGRFRVLKANDRVIVDVSGRDKVKANIAYGLSQQHEQRRHLITNIVIQDLSQNTAHAIAYSIVITHGGTPKIDGTVVYDAQLRREKEGVWQFTSFTVGLDAYGGKPPAPLPADEK